VIPNSVSGTLTMYVSVTVVVTDGGVMNSVRVVTLVTGAARYREGGQRGRCCCVVSCAGSRTRRSRSRGRRYSASMVVLTEGRFCGTGSPRSRVVFGLLFTRYMYVHDIQRINFRAYFTNRTPTVYFLDTQPRPVTTIDRSERRGERPPESQPAGERPANPAR
jgi:hypothetical protein